MKYSCLEIKQEKGTFQMVSHLCKLLRTHANLSVQKVIQLNEHVS